MRAEGALALAGVGGGTILWAEASSFRGYAFAAAAFVALAGVQSGIRALRSYNRHARGADGELMALSSLGTLNDDYTCVANFVVPGTRQGDTDLLVLGPFGILAIEVKTYSGHYACHGDAWYEIRSDGTKQQLRASVSKQVKRNRKALQHYLIDFDVSSPVYAVVVFKDTTRLQMYRPTVPVLSPETLAEYIRELPEAQNKNTVSQIEQFFLPGARQAPAGADDTMAGRISY